MNSFFFFFHTYVHKRAQPKRKSEEDKAEKDERVRKEWSEEYHMYGWYTATYHVAELRGVVTLSGARLYLLRNAYVSKRQRTRERSLLCAVTHIYVCSLVGVKQKVLTSASRTRQNASDGDFINDLTFKNRSIESSLTNTWFGYFCRRATIKCAQFAHCRYKTWI